MIQLVPNGRWAHAWWQGREVASKVLIGTFFLISFPSQGDYPLQLPYFINTVRHRVSDLLAKMSSRVIFKFRQAIEIVRDRRQQ